MKCIQWLKLFREQFGFHLTSSFIVQVSEFNYESGKINKQMHTILYIPESKCAGFSKQKALISMKNLWSWGKYDSLEGEPTHFHKGIDAVLSMHGLFPAGDILGSLKWYLFKASLSMQ